MQHANALRKRMDALEVSCERLYRVVLLKKVDDPVGCASRGEPTEAQKQTASARRFALLKQESDEHPSSHSASAVAGYVRLALFHDLHDMTFERIYEEILEVISGEPGEYKVEVLYWDGDMYRPRQGAYPSRRAFLYDYNPRGNVVKKTEPIYITIKEEE